MLIQKLKAKEPGITGIRSHPEDTHGMKFITEQKFV